MFPPFRQNYTNPSLIRNSAWKLRDSVNGFACLHWLHLHFVRAQFCFLPLSIIIFLTWATIHSIWFSRRCKYRFIWSKNELWNWLIKNLKNYFAHLKIISIRLAYAIWLHCCVAVWTCGWIWYLHWYNTGVEYDFCIELAFCRHRWSRFNAGNAGIQQRCNKHEWKGRCESDATLLWRHTTLFGCKRVKTDNFPQTFDFRLEK